MVGKANHPKKGFYKQKGQQCEGTETNLKVPHNVSKLASRGVWWEGRESNPRHEDFQSSALPTELPSHKKTFPMLKGRAKVNTKNHNLSMDNPRGHSG